MSEFFYTYGTRTSFFVISEIHGCWIARMTEQILISGFLQEIRDIFLFAMLFLKWRSRNNSCIQYEQIRSVFEEIGLWWILLNWARVPLLSSHLIPSKYQLTNMIKFLKGTVLCWPSKRFFNLCLRHLFMTPKGQICSSTWFWGL